LFDSFSEIEQRAERKGYEQVGKLDCAFDLFHFVFLWLEFS